ncbi:S8 family serine peptidase [Paenibacillus sp. OAE614]|uniref:S8 family peptidase n=1 Tax=Paenibacillus sp. OAE614 TaxID=2663804 RepID=UPI00178A8D25
MRKLILPFICCLLLFVVYFTFVRDSNSNSTIVPENASWPFSTIDYASINKLNKTTIRVAIIDTGIDSSKVCTNDVHLASYSVENINKNPNDLHGSIMANIICNSSFLDRKDNSLRKKLELDGINVGHDDDISIDALVEGIQKAIDLNVDIINISLGVYKNNTSLERIIKTALQKNIIVVCSAGNDSTKQSMYPASYKGVITVTSVDPNNNYMLNNNFNNNIIVSAPGENIPTQISKDGKKLEINGTSASAALISSAIISFMSIDPKIKETDLIELFDKTSKRIGPENIYGFGLLDYKKALLSLYS